MAGRRCAKVVASFGSSRSRTKTLNCFSTNPEGPLHPRLRAPVPGGTRCR
jgi:hypothetical protein